MTPLDRANRPAMTAELHDQNKADPRNREPAKRFPSVIAN